MLAYLFIVIAVAMRFLPHPFHFTPVGAALLFFGAYRPRRELWVPVALLAASDVLLNRFVYGYRLQPDQVIIWAWYAAIVAVGLLLAKRVSPLRVTGAALSASVSFFLLSNFAVWVGYSMYPKTWEGLTACYVAAIPFFRNTVASDLVFSAVLFGAPAAIAAFTRQHDSARL
jgi:hypothetical protein